MNLQIITLVKKGQKIRVYTVESNGYIYKNLDKMQINLQQQEAD